MTQMIWQAVHHLHTDETTPPRREVAAITGEPIATRHPDLERILAAIQEHEVAEMDAVAAYQDLAYATTDPVVRGLLAMLAEDERHHHRVFSAVATNIRAVAARSGIEANLPPRGVPTEAMGQLREYARNERDGAAELRALAREAPGLFGGVVALLLELLAFDGEKHERILRFVVKELETVVEAEPEPAAEL